MKKNGDTFSGCLGIALVPDEHIRQEADRLRRRLLGPVSTTNKCDWIVLYRTFVRDIPYVVIRNTLQYIATISREFTLCFSKVETGRDGIVMWLIEDEAVHRYYSLKELQRDVWGYYIGTYLDHEKNRVTDEDILRYTDPELDNIRMYGYPHYGVLYRPHIVLARKTDARFYYHCSAQGTVESAVCYDTQHNTLIESVPVRTDL